MKGAKFRQIDRLDMHLPLRVAMWQSHPHGISDVVSEEYTVTENICSGGCYFFLSRNPPPGSRLEMEITIPGEVHDISFARIYCRGEVVRVDRCAAELGPGQPKFGVAARIERFPDVSVESIPRPAGLSTGEAIA